MSTTTSRSPVAARSSRRRRGALAAVALAVTAGTALSSALPAHAASAQVDDAVFSWTINDEVGVAAPVGGCNFLSAGVAGDTGKSRAWVPADDFYHSTEGNVSILKPNEAGDLVAATWETKCQNRNGVAVTAGAGDTTEARVVIGAGSGTIDVAANTASISWTGSWTIALYGGYTYWSITNPQLTVNADGTAQVTATFSGYGADRDNPQSWVPLDARTGVLTNLTGVSVTENGFAIAPDYLGVEVDIASGSQAREGAYWGAFPQDVVDFTTEAGQGAYWYSSGGAADSKKVAAPLTIAYTADETDPNPGSDPDDGEQIITVVVPQSDPGDPGEFLWTIDGSQTVDLGQTVNAGTYLQATGSITPITVTDTRTGGVAWSISGQVSDFTGGLAGRHLGWTPQVLTSGAGATAGAVVAAGYPTGDGLGGSSVLASATAGHATGTASLGAGLDLRLPVDTDPGTYTATLTITALS